MPAKALHHRHRCKTVWTQTELVLTTAEIEHRIYNFRGVQVMVDQDLADLYGVETRCLNEQVKRNIDRFPERFMFQLTKEEFLNLTSQIATSKWGGRRTLPYVFTEQGVAMLATVLNSPESARISIAIMDAFVSMRHFIAANAQVFQRLDSLEQFRLETKQSLALVENKFDNLFSRLDDGSIKPIEGVFVEG